MANRFLGLVIFFRHGQTDYTEIFPDLTQEGIATINGTAESIKSLLNGHQNTILVASPAVRAMGSIAIVAKTLEHKSEIIKEPRIRPATVRDEVRAKAIFHEYASNGGMRALSLAYDTDPRYENAEIIEPKSEVKKRFMDYFARLAKKLLANAGPPILQS